MPRKKKQDSKSKFSVHIPDNVAKQGKVADDKLNGSADEPVEPKDTSAPAATPEPSAPKVQEPPKTPAKQEPAEPEPNEDWEAKYKVLKGKYDKELGDLRGMVHNLQDLIAQQSSIIESQAKAQVNPEPIQEPKPVPGLDLKAIDPEGFHGYGDEIVALVKAFNSQLEVIDSLNERIGTLQAGNPDNARLDKIEQTVHQTAEDRYFNVLNKEIPNWRAINNDPAFAIWLQRPDDATMYRWADIIQDAAKNYRAKQVIAIFKRYAAENNIDLGIVDPVQAPGDANVPVRRGNIIDDTVDPLASQLVPDQNVAGNDLGQPTPEYPTAAEYNEAVTQRTQGKISDEKFTDISNRFQQGIAAQSKK